MATIGRASAVADFGWMRLKGLVAWAAWLFVHIMNLIGFRNRLAVLVQWAWAYFTFQRSARLIYSGALPHPSVSGQECPETEDAPEEASAPAPTPRAA